MTTTTNTSTTTPRFTFAATVGSSRWYGFTSREAAEAWVAANARGRFSQIVPACLAKNPVAP